MRNDITVDNVADQVWLRRHIKLCVDSLKAMPLFSRSEFCDKASDQ